ncbi:MAG: B12-binding domain-containing radical SAM protein [Promethearchaeota archaeon]
MAMMHRSAFDVYEQNVIHKKIYSDTIRLALIYPNQYHVGMASLAIKLLYYLFNIRQDVYCERVFLPYQEKIVPRSIETNTPLNHFDVLAASFSFELDYINFVKLLLDSGIPLEFQERKERSHAPIILAGGPAVSANPEPISSFIDGFLIGEVEVILSELLEILTISRDKLREELAQISGMYVPSLKDESLISTPIRKVSVQNLDQAPFPKMQIEANFQKTSKIQVPLPGYHIEISRGCSHACKFCLIGHACRPMRSRSLEKLQDLSLEGIKASINPHISMIGSSASEHPDLEKFLVFLNENTISFSLPSLRLDANDEIIRQARLSGQNQLTVALETIDEPLRHAIAKNISDDDLYAFWQKTLHFGFESLKLYIILGLPTQDIDKEIEGIKQVLERLKSQANTKKFINLSVTPFIPKAHTPFQWYIPNYEAVKEGTSKLQKTLKSRQITVSPPRWAPIQALLSMGNAEIGSVLKKVAMMGGTFKAWKEILGNPIHYYTKFHQRIIDNSLPWEHIYLGMQHRQLKENFERFLRRRGSALA